MIITANVEAVEKRRVVVPGWIVLWLVGGRAVPRRPVNVLTKSKHENLHSVRCICWTDLLGYNADQEEEGRNNIYDQSFSRLQIRGVEGRNDDRDERPNSADEEGERA